LHGVRNQVRVTLTSTPVTVPAPPTSHPSEHPSGVPDTTQHDRGDPQPPSRVAATAAGHRRSGMSHRHTPREDLAN
jgi:hypothetical protein